VVQKTLIDGRVYFDRQRDIAERAEREKEKKALIDKLKKSRRKNRKKRNPTLLRPPGKNRPKRHPK